MNLKRGGVLRVGGGGSPMQKGFSFWVPHGVLPPPLGSQRRGGGISRRGFRTPPPGVWPGGEGFFKGVKWGHLGNKGGSPWFGVNGVLVPLAGFHMLVSDRASV